MDDLWKVINTLMIETDRQGKMTQSLIERRNFVTNPATYEIRGNCLNEALDLRNDLIDLTGVIP